MRSSHSHEEERGSAHDQIALPWAAGGGLAGHHLPRLPRSRADLMPSREPCIPRMARSSGDTDPARCLPHMVTRARCPTPFGSERVCASIVRRLREPGQTHAARSPSSSPRQCHHAIGTMPASFSVASSLTRGRRARRLTRSMSTAGCSTACRGESGFDSSRARKADTSSIVSALRSGPHSGCLIDPRQAVSRETSPLGAALSAPSHACDEPRENARDAAHSGGDGARPRPFGALRAPDREAARIGQGCGSPHQRRRAHPRLSRDVAPKRYRHTGEDRASAV
jgi:hypothetical protein